MFVDGVDVRVWDTQTSQGWSDEKLLLLVLDFVIALDKEGELVSYLKKAAQEEDEQEALE